MVCFWLENVLSFRPENDLEFQQLKSLRFLLNQGVRVKGEEMPEAWEDPYLVPRGYCINCGCANDPKAKRQNQKDPLLNDGSHADHSEG